MREDKNRTQLTATTEMPSIYRVTGLPKAALRGHVPLPLSFFFSPPLPSSSPSSSSRHPPFPSHIHFPLPSITSTIHHDFFILPQPPPVTCRVNPWTQAERGIPMIGPCPRARTTPRHRPEPPSRAAASKRQPSSSPRLRQHLWQELP